MNMRVLSSMLLFFLGSFLGAQNINHVANKKLQKGAETILLSKTASDDENSRSMGMVLLFELKSDVVQRSLDQVSGDPLNWLLDTMSFENLQKNSPSNEVKNRTKKLEIELDDPKKDINLNPSVSRFIRIKLPLKCDILNAKLDACFNYGYLFNEHRNNPIEPLSTLFVIENYYNKNRSSRIWVDFNNNFDLTDDSVFQWKYPAQSIAIPFPKLNSLSQIRIAKFPYYKFRQFSSMQDTAMRMLSNGRIFVGSRECLKAVRENILFGEFYTGMDTVKVGLQDVNLNGDFFDLGIDRIVISSQKNSEFSAALSQPLQKENFVIWMGRMYQVQPKFTEVGAQFQFLPSFSKKHAKSLLLDKKFPNFRFEAIEKPKVKKNKSLNKSKKYKSEDSEKKSPKKQKNSCRSVRRIKANSKLVYIWSAENESFINDSFNLHHFIRLHPDIQLIMLNFGGSSKYLSSYNNRYQIDAIQGILTSKNVKKMKLQTMPQYFLLDKKNRIKFMGHSVYQLNELNLN